MLNIGAVIAAFSYADNVGFQDHRNFGAYNLHFHYIAAWYPFPPASHQSVARQGVGFSSEVAATFPLAGFSPAGEYELCSARLCSL